MADAALDHVDAARAIFAGVRGESAGPGHLIRIDIDDRGLRVHGGAAPFRAAIEARKNHGIFSDAEGNKLALAAQFLEIFERPLTGLGRRWGKWVIGDEVAGERRG